MSMVEEICSSRSLPESATVLLQLLAPAKANQQLQGVGGVRGVCEVTCGHEEIESALKAVNSKKCGVHKALMYSSFGKRLCKYNADFCVGAFSKHIFAGQLALVERVMKAGCCLAAKASIAKTKMPAPHWCGFVSVLGRAFIYALSTF